MTPLTDKKTTAQETRKNFYKNKDLLIMFSVLRKVDEDSKEMDFGIRLKNKKNFKLLKDVSEVVYETMDEINNRMGKKAKDGKTYLFKYKNEAGVEVDNIDSSFKERTKILDMETEIELSPVDVQITTDPETRKTDTQGIQINNAQMDILEPIFNFVSEE